MAAERDRYFRRLRRLRRSARRWSVLASALGGATAVFVPYAGLGPHDAIWAAAAGGSTALALWRWSDLRALAAQPVPAEPDPALAAERSRARLVAMVNRVPGGRDVLQTLRRQRDRALLQGSAAAEPWRRLDRAAVTLAGLADRLTGSAAPALTEATQAERSLRELAHRVASVEKALRLAPDDSRGHLVELHRGLTGQLTEGVTAYERLVGAAAAYVAQETDATREEIDVPRLTAASDLLHGVAAGLAELRTVTQPSREPH
ncbi:MAG TPA: hypothetical protein VFX61_17000 [Micromonosporaceae bacterium]|nr:hypothetical protein [Micromonosporaceae bacterium]